MENEISVSPLRASQLLGISRTTLYALLATGEIPSFTWGRSRRIPLEALRKLVNEKAQRETAAAAR